jgi:hypothetical protein
MGRGNKYQHDDDAGVDYNDDTHKALEQCQHQLTEYPNFLYLQTPTVTAAVAVEIECFCTKIPQEVLLICHKT